MLIYIATYTYIFPAEFVIKIVNYVNRNVDDDSVSRMKAAEEALEAKEKVRFFLLMFSPIGLRFDLLLSLFL